MAQTMSNMTPATMPNIIAHSGTFSFSRMLKLGAALLIAWKMKCQVINLRKLVMYEPKTAKNQHLLYILSNNFVNTQSFKNLNAVFWQIDSPAPHKKWYHP